MKNGERVQLGPFVGIAEFGDSHNWLWVYHITNMGNAIGYKQIISTETPLHALMSWIMPHTTMGDMKRNGLIEDYDIIYKE